MSRAAAIIPRMRLELEGVEVRGAGWAEACSMTMHHASAYVVSVITVVPTRALALVSAYVADLSGHAAVTHLRLPPGGRSFSQQELGRLPGSSHARACLLDHAAELRLTLEQLLDEPVRIEIPDAALERAGSLWERPPEG
jgi:hypothetical protein